MSHNAARWNALFSRTKPVLAMLHLGGETPEERCNRAVEEARILSSCGVDAVIVENYFGDRNDVERVLTVLSREDLGVRIGLNLLRDTAGAFSLAREYHVDFIQIDSVAGHLAPEADAEYAEQLANWRKEYAGAVLGGVRFKYQPVESGRSEREDLQLGSERCDAIVVTGAGTGQETELEKVRRFRSTLGAHVPLVIGAGLTAENVVRQFAVADGGIVGSSLKDSRKDAGVVSVDHVREFLQAVSLARDAYSRRESAGAEASQRDGNVTSDHGRTS